MKESLRRLLTILEPYEYALRREAASLEVLALNATRGDDQWSLETDAATCKELAVQIYRTRQHFSWTKGNRKPIE